MKKLFGFNLDVELKERLAKASKKKYTNSSVLLNQILSKWLDAFEGIKEKPQKVAPPRPQQTEEDRIKDWEWRQKMVLHGKLPEHMGDEYPIVDRPPEFVPVYLNEDGKVNDAPLPLEDEKEIKSLSDLAKEHGMDLDQVETRETEKEMGDREFEESIKMSMEETE